MALVPQLAVVLAPGQASLVLQEVMLVTKPACSVKESYCDNLEHLNYIELMFRLRKLLLLVHPRVALFPQLAVVLAPGQVELVLGQKMVTELVLAQQMVTKLLKAPQ